MKSIKRAAKIGSATLLAWVITGIASAQTTATTTPGVPNTGVGGDAIANIVMLAISAVVALIGIAYLSRRWAAQS